MVLPTMRIFPPALSHMRFGFRFMIAARKYCAYLSIVTSIVLTAAPAVVTAQEPQNPQAIELFESKIRPVLAKRCYSCHSTQADTVEGGLLLDSADGVT